jgi:hypothetical protein
LLTVFSLQRAASSSANAAGDATATRLNLAAAASTTLALGSMAWYYHLYGPVAFAMTPAEEGYVMPLVIDCCVLYCHYLNDEA